MKKVLGRGINDADYQVHPTIDGKKVTCPFYSKWHNMLVRCYCPKFLAKCPTYVDCIICDEWLYFSNFKAWMETQDWKDKHLDKDLFGDGKLYAPKNCCFVEPWLNKLFCDSASIRGKYPMGVTKREYGFDAKLSVDGVRKYLGLFKTPEEAYKKYKTSKAAHVKSKMQRYPNKIIKQAVLNKLKVFFNDYNANNLGIKDIAFSISNRFYEKNRVFEIGINDTDYKTDAMVNNKKVRCPFYGTWHHMLERCYSSKFLVKHPTYKGCTVCNEWLYFSNFKTWMEVQDWRDKELDKDLLGSGKLYSPKTCCFIEHWLNSLLNKQEFHRGKYPIGACKVGKRFKASLNNNGSGKHIGYFDTPKEASQAYKKAKLQYVKELMQDYPNPQIKQAALKKAGY